MQRKLYYACLKITKIKAASQIVSYVITYIVRVVVRILIMIGVYNKKNSTTEKEARNELEKIASKPRNGEVVKCLQDINEIVDLSIIIPAYNAEKTIERCLHSIENSSKYVIEVIVINDGSEDYTGEILEQYSALENLIILTQENKGFSGARNTGIVHAKGNYIMFLDADDELGFNAISILMNAAMEEEASIVSGGYHTIYEEKAVYSPVKDCITKLEKENMTNLMLGGFAWGKVYKRSLFEEIRFPEGYLFEDSIMTFLIYRKACGEKVATVSKSIYKYYKNMQGITATYHRSLKCIDAYWIIEKMYEETIRLGLPMDSQLFELIFGHLKLTYWRTFRLDKKVREYIFILSAELMEKVIAYKTDRGYNFYERKLLQAYRERNYRLWKICSFVLE